MTGQHPEIADRNLRILESILDKVDGNSSAIVSWYHENAPDAELPYDKPGKESGVVCVVRKGTKGGGKFYFIEYTIVNKGERGEKYTTMYNVSGEEVAIYRLPQAKYFRKSPATVTSRLSEFQVWSQAEPRDFPEELNNARQRLYDVAQHENQAQPGDYIDRIVREALSDVSNRPGRN